jgi:shikimate dehydrogenase
VATVRLLGESISYSASPQMHMAAFAALGMDHTYELADVTADELPAAVDQLRDEAFLGANVTVPHKTAVLDLVDGVDELAERAGAVNTIVNRGGALLGTNTDIPAIADEIRKLREAPRRAVVLGAGGAAGAVTIALEQLDVIGVTRVSRAGGGGAASWTNLRMLMEDADVLVNATPVGTDSDESPIEARLMRQSLAVLDLVYRPSPTRLVHDARMRGLEARAGAGVLLGQGWRSLEAWLGIAISDDVRRVMADALAAELGSGADV